jgi:hypothetical protein
MAFKDTCKTLKKVDKDEPIFVLRGQDKLAPALVEAWAALAEEHGVDSDRIREATSCANQMRFWQPRKFPD